MFKVSFFPFFQGFVLLKEICFEEMKPKVRAAV
jgi:hypothetical protein